MLKISWHLCFGASIDGGSHLLIWLPSWRMAERILQGSCYDLVRTGLALLQCEWDGLLSVVIVKERGLTS